MVGEFAEVVESYSYSRCMVTWVWVWAHQLPIDNLFLKVNIISKKKLHFCAQPTQSAGSFGKQIIQNELRSFGWILPPSCWISSLFFRWSACRYGFLKAPQEPRPRDASQVCLLGGRRRVQADGLLGGPFRRFVWLENAPGNARSRGRDGERLLCENERLWWCEERGWGGCVTGDFIVKPSVDSSCKKWTFLPFFLHGEHWKMARLLVEEISSSSLPSLMDFAVILSSLCKSKPWKGWRLLNIHLKKKEAQEARKHEHLSQSL